MESRPLRDRIDTRVATSLDRRLVERLLARPSRVRWSGAALGARALATAVHLVVLGLLVGGTWLLALGANPVQRLAGAVLLLPLALLVRARSGPDPEVPVDPARAPELTALVGEVARELGTPPPTHLAVDDRINAFAWRGGLRTRSLVIGAPLWAALGPQARVALIGHELGHFAGRDVVHVRAALGTLEAWVRAMTPEPGLSTLGHTPVVAVVATWPIRAGAGALHRALTYVNAAASRRSELLADLDAATVAGTAATVEMLRTLLVVDVIDRAANRAAIDPRRPDLAAEIRTRVAGLDDADRETALRDAEGSRVDATHPSTGDRIRLQESLPAAPGRIVLDDARVAAIDAELQPVLATALRRMADTYR